jgi:hypothetical protein
MDRVGYRLPQKEEWVQMGKYATAFRGVWGQVKHIEHNEPKDVKRGPFKFSDGRDHTNIYIQAFRSYKGLPLTYNGKFVVIKASHYELDGGLLDDRPVIHTRKP